MNLAAGNHNIFRLNILHIMLSGEIAIYISQTAPHRPSIDWKCSNIFAFSWPCFCLLFTLFIENEQIGKPEKETEDRNLFSAKQFTSREKTIWLEKLYKRSTTSYCIHPRKRCIRNILLKSSPLWYFCALIEMIMPSSVCAMIRISNYMIQRKVCMLFSILCGIRLTVIHFRILWKAFFITNKKIQLIFEQLHDFHQFRHIRFITI